jgi:class 3 adenylate cyclase/CHASE2 domain-containing sensor protein
VKLKLASIAPITIVAGVTGLICLLTMSGEGPGVFGIVRRLEWISYDWRVRQAASRSSEAATNLGFVFISDDSIDALRNGTLEYRAGLYWPRYVYGRLLHELTAQNAEVVGFDVLFPDLRTDHPHVGDGIGVITSDGYFAKEIAKNGNVVLAAEKGIVPNPFFRTNAWAIGDISTRKEPDGVLRRAKAFETYFLWHPLIKRAATVEGFDLRQPVLQFRKISFPIPGGGPPRTIELDQEGNFDWVKLSEEITGEKFKGIVKPFQKPYQALRVWDMGLVLAAHHLQLDLANAIITPGKITLQGRGIKRVVPVDAENRFMIDWRMTVHDSRLTRESIESLLLQEQSRRSSSTELTNRWKDKLVFIGSTASAGNDLTDLGATPIEKESYLTSRFWNTANSLITDRFIRPTALGWELLLICAAGILAGHLTHRLRPALAVGAVLLIGLSCVWIFSELYVAFRLWLPLVSPLSALFLTHFGVIAYRAFSEQKEQRRIKNVFAKIVSPNVVHELLKAEKLSVVGERRKVTILFADVRGFTQLTETSQTEAEDYVRRHKMSDAEAEAYFNAQSQELLQTINLYLGLIAEIVKKHDGTLDKYIGDCVMAFWGAPALNEKHAVACVRAAIESQRAIYALNEERARENLRRTQENLDRLARGEEPLRHLKILAMGTGISTGIVTVGLMGSDTHIVNYTVFGREVNVASRLEGCSGRGRIVIGAGTFLELLQDAPELASQCIELTPVMVRGISTPISLFEVRWQEVKPEAIIETLDLNKGDDDSRPLAVGE